MQGTKHSNFKRIVKRSERIMRGQRTARRNHRVQKSKPKK